MRLERGRRQVFVLNSVHTTTFTFHCYVFTFTFTFILLLLLFNAMYSLSLISPLLSGSRVFSRDEHTLAHPSKIAPLGKCDQGWKIIRNIWKIQTDFFSHNWRRLFWMWRRNLGNCMKSKNPLTWLLFGCRVADVAHARKRRSPKGQGLLWKEGPPTYAILSQNLVLSRLTCVLNGFHRALNESHPAFVKLST